MKLPELPDLPVRPVLGDVAAALTAAGTAVLVAPPGTGKTTLVPLALAAQTGGKVVVAEPRRLAARAAAARMAALLGEQVGETVGYSVRGDRRAGPRTRIEVVTSGLLVRRLQGDPELAGVDVVMLDECHERHLDADLLLALLLDARDGLRPDLRVLATSATVAADRLATLLGDPAPVIEAHGRTYPVQIAYTPALPRERFEAQVARATRAALAESAGDVLVFLPGAAEIRRVTAQLAGIGEVDIFPLHGRLSTAAQDTALRAGSRRRVVLSTAVAESSLTVPGVRAVVDGGLARVPRIDHRRGLGGLATVRVSAAVAEQRAGRAGREGPGRAWRCWPENEHATLPAYPEPEIRTADLTRLALELACWGTPDGSALSWWDPPPPGALAAGRAVLTALGALHDGEVTTRGRRMATLGLHPRHARALLDGAAEIGPRAAAEVVAVLDDDTLLPGIDLITGLRTLRTDRPDRWRREVQRLTRLLDDRPARGRRGDAQAGVPDSSVEQSSGAANSASTPSNSLGTRTGGMARSNPEAVQPGPSGGRPASDGPGGGDPALIVALAHPERLARRRTPGSASYLMAGGTAVTLPPGSGLGDAEWLAVAVADRDPGMAEGRIRLAAVADEQLARRAAAALLVTGDEIEWADGDVMARRITRLGAITLSDKLLRAPDIGAVAAAVRRGLRAEGLGVLRWSEDATTLRHRLDFLHRTLGDPWPAVDDESLLTDETWLAPELATARRRADLRRIDAGQALRRLLPWPAAARLDELAPERLEVPSGSRIRLDYTTDPPVLAVKVQEIFGWTETPRLAEGRITPVLHLLSPARRPVAVTADLPSFWRTGWPQVRADLRGRYPKHAWPEDPTTVPAHRGTARNAR
ncbi:ATP-dependent RNA helicase [Nocardia sp. alder85J]|uniref:ATP-dependent RNA helicase n=1 Tax=Nocardia sp. alder85J TaxID=2862949 RepID=UPI001CD76A53|nr:ATP-dependent helicase C-terminal domain-containing protein [Nocardia sp. alder85J]MCX4096900.1 helicase-related protein [Nocardia sp. alder85J]